MRAYTALQALVACLVIAAVIQPAAPLEILVTPLQADNPLAQFSLQGLANRSQEGPLVYVSDDPQADPWLPLYRSGNTITAVSPEQLPARLPRAAQGQVLYDPAKPYTVNVATGVAAVMGGVLTDRDLGLPTLFDARNRWPDAAAAYRWAIGTILPTCSKRELALLPPDHAEFRDYAIKNRLFVFDPASDDPQVAGLLPEVIRRLPDGIRVYTTAGPEVRQQLAGMLSAAGDFLVPLTAAEMGTPTGGANFSFHSAFPATGPLAQAFQFRPLGNRLVTFIYTGGEDLGVDLGRYRQMWEDPARGTCPVGWTVSPALATLAPAVLQYYYARAQLQGNDELIMAPNGPGLIYPSAAPSLSDVVAQVGRAAAAAGLTVGLVTERGDAQAQAAVARAYLEGGLHGVFLPLGSPVESQLLAGKPIMQATLAAEDTPGALLQAIRKNAASLIVVLVDPRRFTPSALASVTSRMTPEIYTILPPSQFMDGVRAMVATKNAEQGATGRAEITGLALSPQPPALGQPLTMQADVLSPDGAALVQVVYARPGGLSYAATMTPSPEGTYRAQLAPLYWPGEWTFAVRVLDYKGGITVSQPLTFDFAGSDGDRDGLCDVLEAYLRTDPARADSDADGLLDGNDRNFLLPDRPTMHFVYPLLPPAEAPYLETPGGSTVSGASRQIPAGHTVTWRLPQGALPPGAPAALQLVATGPYTAAISSDGRTFQPAPEGSGPPKGLLVVPIRAGTTRAAQLGLQVTAGEQPATVWGISVTSPPGGPYFSSLSTLPAYPAPGLDTIAQAQVFAPAGIRQVSLHYRVNGGPEQITPALPDPSGSQFYRAAFGRLQNSDLVSWWLEAEGEAPAGQAAPVAVTPVQLFRMGTTRAEMITLLGGRDFLGTFLAGPEWGGNGRWSAVAAQDTARFTPTGGNYQVWVLAAPRGNPLLVLLDGRSLGTVPATNPDGWHKVGTVTLDDREHTLSLQVSGGQTPGGYAQVILTTDPRFIPPAPVTLDTYNSISALYPAPGQTLSGMVEVRATATGNVERVQLLVDGKPQRAVGTPPYLFRWFTRQVADGPHTLELRGLDRRANTMLSVEIPVIVANRQPPRTP